jgi:hypothetical protein
LPTVPSPSTTPLFLFLIFPNDPRKHTAQGISLRVKECLSLGKGVIKLSLQRPLSYKDWEFAISTGSRSLSTDGGSDVLTVATCGGEVVDMSVGHHVSPCIVEKRPKRFTLERILKHERDTLIDFGDLLQARFDEGVYPISTINSKSSGGTEARKMGIRNLIVKDAR